jgi:hypothetical protein
MEGLKLTPAERQILSALKVIANRYDDVYAPQIQDMEADIKKILEKFEKALQTMDSLADKVGKLPRKSDCAGENEIQGIVDHRLKTITLPKLFTAFLKGSKWNIVYLLLVIFLLFPYLQFIFVTLFAAIVEKMTHVNLFEVWPFLKQIIQ